ncbi:MAG TPA: STAS domain-containing protein [Solirubrobacteraceae bacterium]
MGRVSNGTHTAFNNNNNGRTAQHLVLPGTRVRNHTLILTGELDRRSAHALEAEIERLCEDGVTGITLDLRELTYIDAIGVAVIMFRCGLCKRRGYDFALIPGSRFIQRVFDQAGAAKVLPFHDEEVEAAEQIEAVRLSTLAVGHRSRDAC